MDLKRVVVTGLGTVNATARNTTRFHSALRTGHCGIGPVSVLDVTDFRSVPLYHCPLDPPLPRSWTCQPEVEFSSTQIALFLPEAMF